MYNILTVDPKIPIRCKTVLLTSQQFIDLLLDYFNALKGRSTNMYEVENECKNID